MSIVFLQVTLLLPWIPLEFDKVTKDLILVSEDVIVNIEFVGNSALRRKDKGLHELPQSLVAVGQ